VTISQKNERLALTNLAKRTDIVINKADKGCTIIVQDREQYVQDGLSHLANETVYKPLTEDITPWIKAEILSKLESLYRTGMIDKEMHKFCVLPRNIELHNFISLKKLTKIQWESGP